MTSVSIIIPYHSENEYVIGRVLSSINNQIGIDFSNVEVQLINDGGKETDPVQKFSLFNNLDIHYHSTNGVGPGMARQYGIEQSKSDYLMFMDADDEFHNVGSLLAFFNVVKGSGDHQIIISKFLEQIKNKEGEDRFLTHTNHDWNSVYAKWFNRKYIEDIGLKFHPELRIFEDTYFVNLAASVSEDIYYSDAITYAWLYNDKSLVRSGTKSYKRQIDLWAKQTRYSLEFLKRHKPQKVKPRLISYLTETYFWAKYRTPLNWDDYLKEHRKLLNEFKDVEISDNELEDKLKSKIEDKNSVWFQKNTDDFKKYLQNRGDLR
ncbi:MAG: glycosyltransferase family 2 protein [Lactobacillaceae bacterium]|jgi:glycosyltransferase involved in cell wall biosynthesis|nr:glycosyltransferase family 2 protein [Lactobacillaceae bacterium]